MKALHYIRINTANRNQYDLLVSAKIHELVNYYEMTDIHQIKNELEEYINNYPMKNAFPMALAFKFKIEKDELLIYRAFSGSDKQKILVSKVTSHPVIAKPKIPEPEQMKIRF